MKTQEKIALLDNPDVVQILFDILHMKSSKFPEMNLGQHSDYKEIVKELKNRYKQQIEKDGRVQENGNG